MNNNPFVKAVKEQVKGRMSITGPSGSGKTWTALLMATKLVELEGGRIALLDTEGQSAKRYASDFDFDVLDLAGDFNPQHYIDMINAAGEHGYTVLIIDSLSHAWNGSGGVLAIVDKSQMGKNKMSGWIKGRPSQQSLSDAIVQTPVHLICTMRSKTEWDMSKNEQGKISPQKIGLAPVQSSDMEYEFDIAFMLDQQHKMMVSKSRCSPLNDQGNEFTDAGHVTETVYAWLTDGVAPTPLWANINTVKEIFVGFREKSLTDSDIMGFAGVDKWDNYSQWGKYESQEDAIEHINTVWDAELEIDKEQGPPDPASEYDGSLDEPPETNGDRPEVWTCEFTHSAYEIAGKHCVKFANCDPMVGANSGIEIIVAQAYGRSTEFRELIGDYAYEMSGVARYDDAKKTTKFEPLPDGFSIEFEYVEKTIQKGRGKGKVYKEIIGVVGDSF